MKRDGREREPRPSTRQEGESIAMADPHVIAPPLSPRAVLEALLRRGGDRAAAEADSWLLAVEVRMSPAPVPAPDLLLHDLDAWQLKLLQRTPSVSTAAPRDASGCEPSGSREERRHR